jgi:outer membrane receptor for monomeric catechols
MEDAMGTPDTPDRQDIHGQAIDRHTDAGQTATSSSWWRLRRRVVGGRRASLAGGAATEIDEIIVTGQRDYLYRADQSDALGTSIPLAELPATVNVITEDFLEDTRAYDIEDV